MLTKNFSQDQLNVISEIVELSEQLGVSLYMVGGIVRDALLGRPLTDTDLDFIVEGNAIEFASALHEHLGGQLQTFSRFVTAKILNPAKYESIEELDLASSRSEQYPYPGSLPEVELASLQKDLQRRDFTINTLAFRAADLSDAASEDGEGVDERVIDLFDGVVDLKHRVIRVLHDKSFHDDPTRLFRALRYKARLSGALENDTEHLLTKALSENALVTVSKARVFSELKKSFAERASESVFRAFEKYGLLEATNFFSQPCLEKFLLSLVQLDTLAPLFSINEKRSAGIYLLYAAGSEEVRFREYVDLGLGKKYVRKMESIIDVSQEKLLPEMHTIGLLYHLVSAMSCLSRESCLEECRRRGILVEGPLPGAG